MRKLFRPRFDQSKKANSAQEIPTIPLPREALVENPAPVQSPTKSVATAYLVGCAQSPGKVRERNEDALFSLTAVIMNDEVLFPFGVFIVADGMGGHRHGEIASKVAVRTSADLIAHELFLPLLHGQTLPHQLPVQDVLNKCILSAHQTILSEVPGSGTTLSIALMVQDQLHISHVGDSRVYLSHFNGGLKAVTRDHSLVNRMLELGKITKEEAEHHPQRNVLYRALGQEAPPEPEFYRIGLEGCSHVLLCSDGLWGSVPEDEIVKILASQDSPQTAALKLVEEANARGGQDNITSIVIKVPRPSPL